MNQNLKKGFTLIELLVVIAIIGLLSSVVLASLNTARSKGANAAVKSNLNNIRAQAEIIYDNASPNSYATVCADTTTVQKAITAAATAGGATAPVAADWTTAKIGNATTVTCHSTAAGWAAEAPLKAAEGTFTTWCVDSDGSSKGNAGTGLGAASDISC